MVRRLRDEHGQTATEYVGVILVVAAIIAAIAASGIGEQVSAKIKQSIAELATGQGGEAGGGGAGGSGPGGEGSGPGGGKEGGQGGPGSSPGEPPGAGEGGGSGGGARPGGPGQAPGDPRRRVPGQPPEPNSDTAAQCLAGALDARTCLDRALGVPAYFAKKRSSAALDRLRRAERRILTSGARTGSPEFRRLVTERDKARAYYLQTKRTAQRLPVRAAGSLKKVIGTTVGDVDDLRKAGAERLRAQKPPATPQPPRPNTASGGPRTKSAAQRVLGGAKKHGGKLVRGLGIAGVAAGGYTNVRDNGAPKGLTQTAGQALGAYGAGTAMAAGCAALAVTGVGAVACGVGVLAVSIAGSEVGKQVAGAAYDHAIAPAGRAIASGAKKTVSALNPFD